MPTYCVTGGNGLIASHLIRELLSKGHTVHATVRDPSDEKKIGFLMSLDGAKERLRLIKAELMVDGSFDEAVEGVDGVFHTASPVFMPQGDNIEGQYMDIEGSNPSNYNYIIRDSDMAKNAEIYDQIAEKDDESTWFGDELTSVGTTNNVTDTMIKPAIKGTLNLLNSCTKSRSAKRVILTSSCSAIRYHSGPVPLLNESHWSDTEYCKKYNLWYAYAKTMAEREAWCFAKEQNIDLVVVNPSFVVGPLITPYPTSTIQMVLSIMKGDLPVYPNIAIGFVHIDDVVRAHLIAMEDRRASGRLICSSKVAHWSEIIEMLKIKYPSYQLPDRCDESEGNSRPHSMDTTKIRKLGLLNFKSIAQMFDDCIKSFQEKGLL